MGKNLAGVIDMAWYKFFSAGRKKKQEPVQNRPLPEETAVPAVRIGKLHEQGARAGQQDCFGVSDESLMEDRGLLAVVADGMGGLADGEKVSEAVVGAVLDGFILYQGICTPEQQLLMLAKQAAACVNGLLGASGIRKSGSTMVMGLVRDGAFSFLSVGDSRVCLYRQGILMQLNREHVFKDKLALDAVNGKIPLQEVYTDSRRSGLTSFVGMGALEHIDLPSSPVKLVFGDKLLLMSDGVYNALDEQELTACLDAAPVRAVERLRQAIQEKAYTNQDNYTAVLIEYGQKNEIETGRKTEIAEVRKIEIETEMETGTAGKTETEEAGNIERKTEKETAGSIETEIEMEAASSIETETEPNSAERMCKD